MVKKYDYKKVVNIIVDRYNNGNTVITYSELEDLLELDTPLGVRSSKNHNAIGELRKHIKNAGYTIESAMRGRLNQSENASDYRYYTILKLSDDNSYEILGKENELETYKNKCHALEKDNQRLYLEIEKLKEEIIELEDENEQLVHQCMKANDKEEEYVKIISSYSKLLELNR